MALNSFTKTHAWGEASVATAGTAVQLDTTSRLISGLVITAKAGNIGQVYVGGSDVDNTTNDGLDAGESQVISHRQDFDISEIYIDCDSGNTDGVEILAAL